MSFKAAPDEEPLRKELITLLAQVYPTRCTSSGRRPAIVYYSSVNHLMHDFIFYPNQTHEEFLPLPQRWPQPHRVVSLRGIYHLHMVFLLPTPLFLSISGTHQRARHQPAAVLPLMQPPTHLPFPHRGASWPALPRSMYGMANWMGSRRFWRKSLRLSVLWRGSLAVAQGPD